MDITVITEDVFSELEIPGYHIQKFLNRGGMGSVYLATDDNLKRQVAIKVIHEEFSKNEEYVKRFTKEAEIVAGFRHANIVTVHSSGWSSGNQFLVMEYVAGGTLTDCMGTPSLTEGDAASIGMQMADALAYAHQRDIIHRDFKPANILMREDGTPVLSDFGIAKSEVDSGVKTEAGIVIGNMRYMAPEQALGKNIGSPVDVYSFGLVLHEMLTGELPARHPVRTKQDAKEIIRSVRSELGELVGRCLSVDPTARPSAAECRDWLKQKSAVSKPGARTRMLAVAASVAVLLLTAGIVWRSGILKRNETTVSPAIRQDNASVFVERFPLSAKVFVDGVAVAQSMQPLASGEHEWVAIADGYYGEIRHGRFEPRATNQTLSFRLEPTTLPNAAEIERFSMLADAKGITDADVRSMQDRTLSSALSAKLWKSTGNAAELDKLLNDIETLRRFGDSRAAVAAFLVDSVQAGRIGRSQVTQSLIEASNNGDPMASLFLAVSYRESINGARWVSPSDARFRNYCERMALALQQGWDDVAGEYMRRDHCGTG